MSRLPIAPCVALAVMLAAPAGAEDVAPPRLKVAQASRWDWLRERVFGSQATNEIAAETLARDGGSRLLLKADGSEYLAAVLAQWRDGVRRVMREDRIAYGTLAVHDDGVELRLRDAADLPRAMSALAKWAGRAAEIRDMGAGLVRVTPPADWLGPPIGQAVEVLTRGLTEAGIAGAGVQRDGTDRIVISLPGVKDAAPVWAKLSARAHLALRLIDLSVTPEEALRRGAPADSEVLYAYKSRQPYLVKKSAVMEGHDIVEAVAILDQRTNQPVVSLRFAPRGARELGRVTDENIGQPLAFVLDNEVIAAPVIREPIMGGSVQVSGGFTVEEANDLAIRLRAGALPVGLSVIEQQTIERAQKK
jgi:preprotein translocase subunit SecD